MPEPETDLVLRLGGGDRRSVGQADDVARDIESGVIDPLQAVNLMTDSADPVIRMRAADAIEKATRTRHELLEAVQGQLLDLMEIAQQQELRWHLSQMAPRLQLSDTEAQRVVQALESYLDDSSSRRGGTMTAESPSGHVGDVKTIERDELSKKLAAGDRFRLVMSLNEWAYNAKHIPGSEHFNTPEELFASLRPDEEIVVYCTSTDCHASVAM